MAAFCPALELYNSYEPGDVRKELYLTGDYTTPAGVKVKVDRPHINKYVDPSGTENNNSNNWPTCATPTCCSCTPRRRTNWAMRRKPPRT